MHYPFISRLSFSSIDLLVFTPPGTPGTDASTARSLVLPGVPSALWCSLVSLVHTGVLASAHCSLLFFLLLRLSERQMTYL